MARLSIHVSDQDSSKNFDLLTIQNLVCISIDNMDMKTLAGTRLKCMKILDKCSLNESSSKVERIWVRVSKTQIRRHLQIVFAIREHF